MRPGFSWLSMGSKRTVANGSMFKTALNGKEKVK